MSFYWMRHYLILELPLKYYHYFHDTLTQLTFIDGMLMLVLNTAIAMNRLAVEGMVLGHTIENAQKTTSG